MADAVKIEADSNTTLNSPHAASEIEEPEPSDATVIAPHERSGDPIWDAILEATDLSLLSELLDNLKIANLPLPVLENIISRVICDYVDEEITGLRSSDGVNQRTIGALLCTSQDVRSFTKYLLGEMLGYILDVDGK